MKWDRQEYLDLLTFNHPRSEMLCEPMGLMVGLHKEWAEQGANAEELDLTAFGMDYVPYFTFDCTRLMGAPAERILEDTEEYRITLDGLGRRMKLIKSSASQPLPLNFPVRDMDSWRAIRHLFEYDSAMLDEDAMEEAKQLQAQGTLIRVGMWGGFDLLRQLMGDSECCIAFYEQPELICDILRVVGDTAFQLLEKITRSIKIDYLGVMEDLAGKGGPLIGPNMVTQFIKPYYRKIWDLLQYNGTRVFAMDSDGNITPVINAFIDCGINLFLPCEPAAGMDIVSLRSQYGQRFAMLGGIDKHVLRRSKQEILAELEYKFDPNMRGGGICFGLDHRIPNGTPLDHYRYYVATAKEILGIHDSEPGWGRMAF